MTVKWTLCHWMLLDILQRLMANNNFVLHFTLGQSIIIQTIYFLLLSLMGQCPNAITFLSLFKRLQLRVCQMLSLYSYKAFLQNAKNANLASSNIFMVLPVHCIMDWTNSGQFMVLVLSGLQLLLLFFFKGRIKSYWWD